MSPRVSITATNAWGEPREPNPVLQVTAIRAAQLTAVAVPLLAAFRTLDPAFPVGLALAEGGGIGAAGLSAYLVATFHPRTPLLAAGSPPLVVRLPARPGPPVVALTFDDGPHPDTTPRILDHLAAHHSHATFFFVGERAARFPHLVRRAAGEGHAVGIHGLRHRTFVLHSRRALEEELHTAADAIENALGGCGKPIHLVRPPYGFKTATVARVAAGAGLRVVAWSLDARDYASPSPDAVVARLERWLAPRDIVLIHERPDHTESLDALPRLLAFCAGHGWRAVALAPPYVEHQRPSAP